MKKIQYYFLTVFLAVTITPVAGQNDQNTFDIRLAQKAPTLKEKQNEFLQWKFGMFVHFGMGTFVNREWATGHEDPLLFAPDKLDCRQWAKEAKAAGMDYMVLTTKHTGGWCLWDSQYTDHDVTAFKNYKNGRGDIVKSFVDACRKERIKVGLYYCLPGDYSTRFGNKEDVERGYKITPDQEDLHGLPPEAKGDYEGFIEKQVTELLTRYGTIDLLWFDQYNNKYTGKHWRALKKLVHQLQPRCIVIANNAHNYADTDIYSYEYPYFSGINKMERALPPKGNENPGEVSDAIAIHDWFWKDGINQELQSAEEVVDRLRLCNHRKCNYLLNVQPDDQGLISGPFLERLREIGKLVENVR